MPMPMPIQLQIPFTFTLVQKTAAGMEERLLAQEKEIVQLQSTITTLLYSRQQQMSEEGLSMASGSDFDDGRVGVAVGANFSHGLMNLQVRWYYVLPQQTVRVLGVEA